MSEEALKKALARERAARKAAEEIVEQKSRELYEANEGLKQLNHELENRIDERTRALSAALERTEASARAKSQFLSMMSHEMRTPLNAIIGLSDLLCADAAPEQDLAYLKTLRFSARQLLGLVNDALDVSSVESGKVAFQSTRFDIAELGQEIRQLFAQKASGTGLDWSVNIDSCMPTVLEGDVQRLNQVIINLVDNAFKFTPTGSVRFMITCAAEQPDPLVFRLRFEVRDSGIGIAPEHQHRIFEFFEQAHTGIRREFGGSGIGLALSRRLVELQGGTLDFESAPGAGTRFWFELPFKKMAADDVGPIDITDSGHLTGFRVLLVEDSPTNRLVIREMARRWGVLLTEAEDGAEALARLEETSVDLVLTDLHMPGVDGLELIKTIRARTPHDHPRLPVVCLTADVQSDLRDAVLEAGADSYITKPIELAKLYEALSYWAKAQEALATAGG